MPWTDSHVAAANDAICKLPTNQTHRYSQWVSTQLARKFDAPSISLTCHGPIERDFWSVSSVARAVILRSLDCRLGPQPSASDFERAVRRLTQAFRKSLEEAISAFARDFLEANFARHAWTVDAAFVDPTIYNYFVLDPTNRNRSQLATASPYLANIAAMGADPDSRALRQIVDAGKPLVRLLADRFGCKPVSVRTLARKARVARRWVEERPRVIARLLDLVPPERHPSSNEAWQQFDELVNCARLVFRTLTSTAAQAFLREHIGRRSDALAQSDLSKLLGQAAQIQTLEKHLADYLVRQCRNLKKPRVVVRQAKMVARSRLALRSYRELSALAKTFCGELARHGAYVQGIDESFNPVLPMFEGNIVACDGQRRVVCVTTEFELRRVGTLLSNCLARPRHVDRYSSRLRSGCSFFLAILNECSEKIESMAEVERAQDVCAHQRHVYRVIQHRAAHNEPPSQECRRALREAIRRVRSTSPRAAGQQHAAQRQRAAASRDRRSTLLSKVDDGVVERLLRASLGDACIGSMIQLIMQKSLHAQATQRQDERQLILL
jgi:hypothetical protein